MLKTKLLHPQILSALASAGHGSKVLISDANYPHSTARGPNAQVVYLNFAPGKLNATEVLKTLIGVIPIEAATIMDRNKTGPYTMPMEPDIWNEFAAILSDTDAQGNFIKVERSKFYDLASAPDVCLTIATGEERIYANLLLTIGVVRETPTA